MSLALYIKLYGEAHPRVAYGLSNLGALLINQEDSVDTDLVSCF